MIKDLNNDGIISPMEIAIDWLQGKPYYENGVFYHYDETEMTVSPSADAESITSTKFDNEVISQFLDLGFKIVNT